MCSWPLPLLMTADIAVRVVNIVYKQFCVVGDMEMLVPGLVTAVALLLLTCRKFAGRSGRRAVPSA